MALEDPGFCAKMKDWVTGPLELDRWNWTTGIVPLELDHWDWTTGTRFGNKIAPIEAQPIAQPVPISILSHLEWGQCERWWRIYAPSRYKSCICCGGPSSAGPKAAGFSSGWLGASRADGLLSHVPNVVEARLRCRGELNQLESTAGRRH